MKEFGYCRVAALVPEMALANPMENATNIFKMAKDADASSVEIAVFPELSITGYTCADLFGQDFLLEQALSALFFLCEQSKALHTVIIVGAPIRHNDALFNCAVVIGGGSILGIVPKQYIPNYGEFYEKRWFNSGRDIEHTQINVDHKGNNYLINFGTAQIFQTFSGVKFGIEICEDLWVPAPPSQTLANAGAEIIFNLSATDENIGKHRYLRNMIASTSAACRCGYVYASAGVGESSTDLVFSGNAIIAENGKILAESPRFHRGSIKAVADIDVSIIRHDRRHFNSFSDGPQPKAKHILSIIPEPPKAAERTTDLLRSIDPHPFVPSDPSHLTENCEEIISIQCWGLEQRLLATRCTKLIIGISGGLDSTLALLVACRAFDRLGLPRKGIIGITMPGEATSDRTKSNATGLMEILGITHMEIPINPAVAQHFKDIGQDPEKYDAAYENSQARERTQILMDMANKEGGMVLGTGDLSELALGWCTYNGDHMSMYAVNASVPKTLVKHLVSWFASQTDNEQERAILTDIIDTPISPELVPSSGEEEIGQKTEDIVGPYELHDFYLFHTLRYGSSPKKVFHLARIAFKDTYDGTVLLKWLKNFYRRFFSQQFKRSCMPDGPKVGSVCLSPRGDWRMPSDAQSAMWLKEVESF